MTNYKNVALRTKLLEALHNAPPKMKTSGLPDHEDPTKQNLTYQGGEAASHKQNSGSIQADSLASQKAPPKTGSRLQNQNSNRNKPAPSKYEFSFDHIDEKDEGTKSHSSKYVNQRSDRKKIPADPQRKPHPGIEDLGTCLPANGRKRLPSHKKGTNFTSPPSKAKKRVAAGSSDDTREATDSPYLESSSSIEVEKHLPQSPEEEKNARSARGCRKPNKSSGTLHQSKRVRIQEDLKPRADGTTESHEASEAHLSSKSFSQMTSVLEGFNTKLKSHTSRKGSEILSSALNKVQLQLQGVDSQIQSDIGKLTNVGKSKRKRLESTFQEQHERLRLLYDKFKEEVNQQILDCRTTVEELDAYQLELKGTAERQRASHRKLILQAEEAMKAQLSDADTCIAAVNMEATHKMSGLKLVLDEWIAEGQVC